MGDIFRSSVQTINKVIRIFKDKDLPQIQKIATLLKNDLEKFRPWVPVGEALRAEGMKDRHWEAISEEVGFEVKPGPDFTFQTCMEMNLVEHEEFLVDIGEKASKEYGIECSLNNMLATWEDINFNLIPFKKTGTSTVTGFDEAIQTLDEHIVAT